MLLTTGLWRDLTQNIDFLLNLNTVSNQNQVWLEETLRQCASLQFLRYQFLITGKRKVNTLGNSFWLLNKVSWNDCFLEKVKLTNLSLNYLNGLFGSLLSHYGGLCPDKLFLKYMYWVYPKIKHTRFWILNTSKHGKKRWASLPLGTKLK